MCWLGVRAFVTENMDLSVFQKKTRNPTNKPNNSRKLQIYSSLDVVGWIREHGGRKGLVSLQYYISGDTTEIVVYALKITDWPHISVFTQNFHVFSQNST